MDCRLVGDLLEKCLGAAAATEPRSAQPTEPDRRNLCSSKDSMCAELASLLQEAVDMKWPFVPEKWQYKLSLGADDKTNLSDLITKNLPQLLSFLKATIVAQEARTALAVVFLLDRFLYWTDESSRLLKITKVLHRRHPDTPVAPQLVIRLARVYLNSGKLQKAEHILSSLINSSGSTGCWSYRSESDRALVQAVSVQVRGMVLQKLGLWLQAAELIWASLVGYYSLPQPDKKGIGCSLCILANILVSMNDEDFDTFRTNPIIELESLLGNVTHRLLSAARAAKMAVVYSQYTPLFVLTNATTQGTCLLSYSFSAGCPDAQRHPHLQQAAEAFAIALLARTEGERVASKQELHTSIKAAHSLAVARKWLGAPQEPVALATRACREALGRFCAYGLADHQGRESLGDEVMRLVARARQLLRVEPSPHKDRGSFIPRGYQDFEDTPVRFTPAAFSRLMQRFRKYHALLCEAGDSDCKATRGGAEGSQLCISALGTTVDTASPTEACKVPPPAQPPPRPLLGSAGDLSSSWLNFSLSGHGSPGPSGGDGQGGTKARNGICPTTEVGETQSDQLAVENKECASSDSEKFEVIQAEVETQFTEEDQAARLIPGSSSSSLGDSFGSRSSWEKIPAHPKQPACGGTRPTKAGTGSPESHGSFELLETCDSAQSHTPEMDSASPEPAAGGPASSQCASTEPSSDHSFELVEANEVSSAAGEANEPGEEPNPLCLACLDRHAVADEAPGGPNLLSQDDYRALLAGVCHACLLRRSRSGHAQFKLKEHNAAHSALHLQFSKATGLWTARETCVCIGEPTGMQGKQRAAVWVQFLHQEERLSSYVGKDYLEPKPLRFHLRDVERQMTAQHYVTAFNKSLYDRDVMAQLFFIPSEALLILDGHRVVGCVTVEPYMLGDFVKLTNNTWKKDTRLRATDYGLAFGHFTYQLSGGQEVVVDLQGWVTANGKGLTYLTDPQIHSTKSPRGPSNFAAGGLRYFLEEQHGPKCNAVCRLLQLPPLCGSASRP